eukprot:TRINITY_DN11839_c0_g1_i1.p1 TRINITY_DN11839_c0_g1~~TRINITY_DN11839_c0_g1_i1.p1  ORF type:complete len:143 (+),score=4.52 TRINITY_DN11839_c0_g1_i1:85-513(+)
MTDIILLFQDPATQLVTQKPSTFKLTKTVFDIYASLSSSLEISPTAIRLLAQKTANCQAVIGFIPNCMVQVQDLELDKCPTNPPQVMVDIDRGLGFHVHPSSCVPWFDRYNPRTLDRLEDMLYLWDLDNNYVDLPELVYDTD